MSNTPLPGSMSLATWARIAVAVVAAVLLLLFILKNASTVEIDFIFGTVETRLVWALLLSAGLGLLIGAIAPRLRDRRDDDE